MCDYVYRLVLTRFEVLGHATTTLNMVLRKSLNEESKVKIRVFSDCLLTEKGIPL